MDSATVHRPQKVWQQIVNGWVVDPESSEEREGFLRLEGLTKRYGDSTVVSDLTVSVRRGELVAFLGPSGCGKTTTLRMIAGFIDADGGSIYIDDQRIDGLPSRLRGTAMVFQDYALFPHMTIADNIGFGLRMRKVPKQQRLRRVREVLDLVQLGDVESKYPSELSGGMRQRVALARAIVVEPRILLLDEPLSNLDAKLRKQLRVELREMHERIGITTVFVTHDIEEAFYLADRVVVMNNGMLEQFDAPVEIYSNPRSPFVADFVGHSNMISGEIYAADSEKNTFRRGDVEIFTTSEAPVGFTKGFYTVPPHVLHVSPILRQSDHENAIRGTIRRVAYFGSHFSVLVEAHDLRLQCHVPIDAATDRETLQAGQSVWVSWSMNEGAFVAQ